MNKVDSPTQLGGDPSQLAEIRDPDNLQVTTELPTSRYPGKQVKVHWELRSVELVQSTEPLVGGGG